MKESFDVDDSFILIPRPTVSKVCFFQRKTTESRDLELGPDLVSDTNRTVMKHTKLTFLSISTPHLENSLNPKFMKHQEIYTLQTDRSEEGSSKNLAQPISG